MIAPDQTTFEYLAGREFVPRGDAWEAALARWRALPTDDGAIFDRSISLDASALEPMITYGTSPGTAMRISDSVPDPDTLLDLGIKASVDKGLRYMAFRPGQRLLGHPIHAVFIGSCTNSRLSDLRLAASLLKGRKVAPNVRVLIVPGSQEVKRQAEAERLDRVFLEAGAEWRHPGCSMCIAMNGDELEPGQYAVSTSNRNFEGRQGKGGRTLLASPLTAAAAAVTGKITDPRTLM
jgi:3-isopropylmalate/(R)-2-methylmalate dehydratase large subunit